jgi:HD-like signal output (HDOD) protein
MKKILIVDDEVQILRSLTRAFFDTDYEIYNAESGPEALKLLENTEVDLVISDMRMPLMDGYELLFAIKEKYPGIIRIMLSGYAEEASIFKAILHNIAKFYILKPWQNHTLLEYIRQIFETEDLLKSKDILELINNIEKLPTIEANYYKILRMIENDEATGRISEEIEKDFAISTKLLQIANSAYFGVRTGSVKKATVFLGLQNLKSLIYSTTILNSFNQYAPRDRITVRFLWEHAVTTNKILHFIYEAFLKKKIPEAACSAGLLHNIGALILVQNYSGQYMKIISKARSKDCNLVDLERDAYRLTHQEAGGYLISWWELPYPIVEAALFHHRPFDPCVLNKEIVAAVHLAQHYAWMHLDQPAYTDFYPEVFEFLGIDPEAFEEAFKEKKFL